MMCNNEGFNELDPSLQIFCVVGSSHPGGGGGGGGEWEGKGRRSKEDGKLKRFYFIFLNIS